MVRHKLPKLIFAGSIPVTRSNYLGILPEMKSMINFLIRFFQNSTKDSLLLVFLASCLNFGLCFKKIALHNNVMRSPTAGTVANDRNSSRTGMFCSIAA